jgi:hypothetical protein
MDYELISFRVFALSSCPGKRVRIDGNQIGSSGRPSVKRSLTMDLDRISKANVSNIINCLDDAELRFLGTEWDSYICPIIEGYAPPHLSKGG